MSLTDEQMRWLETTIEHETGKTMEELYQRECEESQQQYEEENDE